MNEHIEKLIKIARTEVGTREGEKDNMGARIVENIRVCTVSSGRMAWCAAFTAWLMREWLEDEKVREAFGLASFSLAEKWRCRDASAFGWEKWAKQHKIALLPETEKAKVGEFVVYDFFHIGLVIADQV